MAKLQRIVRSNGTFSFSVNIPLTIIEDLSWRKGEILDVDIDYSNYTVVISVEGKDGHNRKSRI